MDTVRITRMLTLTVLAAAAGCDAALTEPAALEHGRRPSAEAAALEGSGFANWRQDFNFGTDGWITASTAEGPAGWCGEIERVARGAAGIAPSASRAYAVVRGGACNAYWSANGFSAGSGPYSPGGGYPLAFPEGGYTSKLDIWLDPAWAEGAGFSYVVSFTDLTAAADDPLHGLRYLAVPVTVGADGLRVDGKAVEEAGWYSFRHTFADDGAGRLSVRFELVRRGHRLVDEAITSTHYTGETVSSFATSGVGTGYTWFEWITPGLSLPIDEHQVRHGG